MAAFWSTAGSIYFANGGEEEIYLGSADWMPRNLYERVEVVFPLKDELLRERVRHEILEAYLADNVKTRFLQKDGPISAPGRPRESASLQRAAAAFNAQEFLVGLAEGQAGAGGDSGSRAARAPSTLPWERNGKAG